MSIEYSNISHLEKDEATFLNNLELKNSLISIQSLNGFSIQKRNLPQGLKELISNLHEWHVGNGLKLEEVTKKKLETCRRIFLITLPVLIKKNDDSLPMNADFKMELIPKNEVVVLKKDNALIYIIDIPSYC
jgi:hypothetical protein